MKSGTIFDNVLITDDADYAKQFGDETWGKTKDPEKKMKDEQDEAERKQREEEDKKKKDEEGDGDDEDEDEEVGCYLYLETCIHTWPTAWIMSAVTTEQEPL